jgi:hypothetical protein
MQITDTKNSDLNALVLCHRSAFPDALSTKLGHRFCSKMLSWYIESERGTLFHLEHEGEIPGYVGGIMIRIPGLPGSATSITQHAFKEFVLAFLIKPWLIFHPESITRISFIWRNIKLKLRSGGQSPHTSVQDVPQNFIPSMGLVVIGVSPEHQGKGYGSMLLKEFESRARNEGFRKISLSVHKDNHQAIKAYKRNGWTVGREDSSGLYMFKDLD